MRRVTTPLALLALLALSACGGGPQPTPSTPAPSVQPEPTTPTSTPRPSPSRPPIASSSRPSPSSSPSPTLVPSAEPTEGPSAAPSASQRPPPSADSFWDAVASSIYAAPGTRLRVTVDGPVSGELHFEADASATIHDGAPIFVCLDGRAYDGLGGFARLDGSWRCGIDAFVRGFRTLGQPVDAWSTDLHLDTTVTERYDILPSGDWRWRYRAENPVVGRGEIRVTLVVRPASGRIVSAERDDPLGRTRWTMAYGASFPAIAVP